MTNKTSRYIDPLTDMAFKKIFGSDPNKDLMIAFLNDVFRGKKHIVDLVYSKTEYHGDIKSEGSVSFDLLCTGDKNEKFIIEVQREKHKNFKERSLFYTSRLISEQAPKGKRNEWDYNLTEIYLIAILEKFEVQENPDDKYLFDICLCNRENGEIFYNKLGYTYIQLSNFTKAEDQLVTDLDKWLYILKHISQMDKIPAFLRKPMFEKLFNIAEYSNLTKEEKMSYDMSLKRKWDNYSVQQTALEEGREQGLEQGREQGLEQGREQGLEQGREQGKDQAKLEIARALKKEGLAIDLIMKTTQLSIEEIEKLKI